MEFIIALLLGLTVVVFGSLRMSAEADEAANALEKTLSKER